MINWYAVYTKPRYEDHLVDRMRDVGIECLNPKLKHFRYRRGKYTDVIEPMFPCYIFCRFDPVTLYHLVRYTRGVRFIVGKGKPLQVPDGIITCIRERLKGGIIEVKPERFSKGQKVVIEEGPFKYFTGIFDRYVNKSERVMVLLSAIQGKLELESWMVKSDT